MKTNNIIILFVLAFSNIAGATTLSVSKAQGARKEIKISPYWTGQKDDLLLLGTEPISYNTGFHKLRGFYCKVDNNCYQINLESANINRLSLGVKIEANDLCQITYKEKIYSVHGTHFDHKQVSPTQITCKIFMQ